VKNRGLGSLVTEDLFDECEEQAAQRVLRTDNVWQAIRLAIADRHQSLRPRADRLGRKKPPAADVLALDLSTSQDARYRVALAEAITAMATMLDGTKRPSLFFILMIAMTVATEAKVKGALLKTILALRNSGGSADAAKAAELQLRAGSLVKSHSEIK
jgi:hypothetical protein